MSEDVPLASPKARKGGKSFLAANGVAQVCALARYVLLARVLGPEQLGIATVLILVLQFFESMTDTGGDRFLVQDRDGDLAQVQKMVHSVYVARGVISALALAAFAWPIALWFDHPELAQGIALIGLAPLIMGLQHLDYRRRQREHDFRSEGRVLAISETVGLAATAAAALVVRDFTAVVYGSTARAIAYVVVSHAVAERPYSLGFAPDQARRLFAFATPLMLNGMLLFLGGQGDRALIGDLVGLTALGQYAAVMLLIFYPTAMVQRYFSTLHLPRLAGARNAPSAYADETNRVGAQALVLAILSAAGFLAVAPLVVPILYGERFATTVLVISLIAVLQSTRFIRIWPTVIALSVGRSGIVLANNVVRLAGIPAAIVGYWAGGGMEGLLIGFLLGELAAFAACLFFVARHDGRSLGPDLVRYGLWSAVCALLIGVGRLWDVQVGPAAIAATAAVAGLSAYVGWRERSALQPLVRFWNARRARAGA